MRSGHEEEQVFMCIITPNLSEAEVVIYFHCHLTGTYKLCYYLL